MVPQGLTPHLRAVGTAEVMIREQISVVLVFSWEGSTWRESFRVFSLRGRGGGGEGRGGGGEGRGGEGRGRGGEGKGGEGRGRGGEGINKKRRNTKELTHTCTKRPNASVVMQNHGGT